MIARTNRTVRDRVVASVVLAGAAATLAACGPVAGTASTDPSDVAAYQTTIAQSRAAEADAAGRSACTAWAAANKVREVATLATYNYTQDANWQWPGIQPTLNAELAAISTEQGQLPSIISTAAPKPSIQTAISDYKSKLDAYAVALAADQAAAASGPATWLKGNPAKKTLNAAATAVEQICR